MKKAIASVFALVLLVSSAAVADSAEKRQSFTGYISDDMCGLDHSSMEKPGMDDKACTLKCVEDNGAFVLADKEHQKVYKLDDQKKPKEFAGAKVRVEGSLSGDTIHVEKITAAK